MAYHFRDRLRQAIKKRGLNQSQAAAVCGLQQPAIARLLAGGPKRSETFKPRQDTIRRLARGLRVPPLWLRNGDAPPAWAGATVEEVVANDIAAHARYRKKQAELPANPSVAVMGDEFFSIPYNESPWIQPFIRQYQAAIIYHALQSLPQSTPSFNQQREVTCRQFLTSVAQEIGGSAREAKAAMQEQIEFFQRATVSAP